ncbi:MAG: gliding motility-associated C-terminal domain-containing protein [Bacteroidota bacterium]|nr:gliding motility-associated C-terminal domain-containing protein [Bacteroidota bacterium]
MKVLKKILFLFLVVLIQYKVNAQVQACPENINFSTQSLTHWAAFNGRYEGSILQKTIQKFDSSQNAPTGTIGLTSINEYGFGNPGIQVLNSAATDAFGGFQTIPTINGYKYTNSILLGSTTVSPGTNRGLIRGVSYSISVPAGPPGTPYTITYAYAMVLENGSHASDQQPLAKATVAVGDSVITCASPVYQLPTNRTAGGNILDQATAIKDGFRLSAVPSPNPIQQASPYRVWTKDWTEVTFDLSPFRGRTVSLTFEADNCIPGGHFAYAYFALRNECNGLSISGPSVVCTNGSAMYTVPALDNATYTWTVPSGWNKVLDSANVLIIKPGNNIGTISIREVNSCADLQANIQVTTTLPTIAGTLTGASTVCTGNNSTTLVLQGKRGNVLQWLSSTDGINYQPVSATDSFYLANNLTQTTSFKTVVQNGSACSVDTTQNVVVTVSPLSIGGSLYPPIQQVCNGQDRNSFINLSGYTGNIVNWQSSTDKIVWNNFSPTKTDSILNVANINAPTSFRCIIQSGVCPADTSQLAQVNIYNASFPKATITPRDTTICFGDKANLQANVTIGTFYSWQNTTSLYAPGNNANIIAPATINATAAPSKSSSYVLAIQNEGCPNLWTDTFHINVETALPITAGPDTSIVGNQPLQLIASGADLSAGLTYSWHPTYGLNNPNVYNPIATLGSNIDTITYFVQASTPIGCLSFARKKITIFKTGPEIFVPSAFTPNGDGRNDILKPITVGISQLDYFRVFNRWGQLLYSTTAIGVGWNGRANGTEQQSGTYVYMAQGKDYTGKTIFRKGTVVLIR